VEEMKLLTSATACQQQQQQQRQRQQSLYVQPFAGRVCGKLCQLLTGSAAVELHL
jgi:hypothetical protein